LKRGRKQSSASKHGRKGKLPMRKYSHHERNRVLDHVHKFVNKLPETNPLTMFAVEKLNKKEMFQDASDRLSKKISRTVWRTIHRVLKYKAHFTVLSLRRFCQFTVPLLELTRSFEQSRLQTYSSIYIFRVYYIFVPSLMLQSVRKILSCLTRLTLH